MFCPFHGFIYNPDKESQETDWGWGWGEVVNMEPRATGRNQTLGCCGRGRSLCTWGAHSTNWATAVPRFNLHFTWHPISSASYQFAAVNKSTETTCPSQTARLWLQTFIKQTKEMRDCHGFTLAPMSLNLWLTDVCATLNTEIMKSFQSYQSYIDYNCNVLLNIYLMNVFSD